MGRYLPALLSFVNVGQTFYAFGWESILLEACFFAMFLGGSKTMPQSHSDLVISMVVVPYYVRRGLIKLRGDPCWRDLTCLYYHYETQPMPNPLSWYLHWAPHWMANAGVLFNHFSELIVPFFYFLPQPTRYRRIDHDRFSVHYHHQREPLMAQLVDPRACFLDPRLQVLFRPIVVESELPSTCHPLHNW